jgi:secreted Zn-dependent insulinase-like peptidase
VVHKVHYSNHEKFNALQSVTFEDLKLFVNHIFDEIKIQALIQGNINKMTALEIGSSIQLQFASSAPIKDVSNGSEIARPVQFMIYFFSKLRTF